MEEKKVENGSTIKVDFTIKLDNGTVVGSTKDEEPVQFTVGKQEVIPGLDRGVVGMEKGEMRSIELPSKEAYGPRMDELVQDVTRNHLPKDFDPQVGQVLEMTDEGGDSMTAMVVNVDEQKIKIDANHPLAGKNLVMDVTVVEIQ
ncbi:MAG: peptidylprolyl isomerase [Chitinispirillaceae bacterium]